MDDSKRKKLEAAGYVVGDAAEFLGLTPFERRAIEKAASRADDALAIASGEKTADQVRRANASFAFPDARIRPPKRER